MQKVPYMLVMGDKECRGHVAVGYPQGRDLGTMTLEAFRPSCSKKSQREEVVTRTT
jgi:threonyl-tRNA synthetase